MHPKLSPLSPLTRHDALLASLLGAGSLALYVRTLAPGLLYGDSGELQTVVYSLGMTHPTGYPVYILLGRLFTLLPDGDPAWRVNLFSAFLGALTVTCIFLIVRLLVGWRLAAVTAALTLAVTPLFWYFSVIAELYVPACAFLAGVLLFLLLWRQTEDRRWLAGSALLGGLSLGVHSSVALAAPGVLVFLAVSTRQRKDWGCAIGAALLGVALSMAAFLALDTVNPDAGYYHATVVPSLSVWGLTPAGFDSPLERLGFLYAARQFNDAMFADPAVTMPDIANVYGQVLKMVFAPLSLALAGLGLFGAFLPRWREGLLLLLGWGVQMVFVTNYAIFDVVVFFVPTFVFLAVWIGTGLGTLMDTLAGGLKRLRLQKWITPATALPGIIALGLLVQFWGDMVSEAWEQRAAVFIRGTEFDGYPFPLDDPQAPQAEAQVIVAAIEDNAIVFLNWDLLFPCYFVARQEGRSGIDFHETYPQEGLRQLGETTIAYLEANLGRRPIYFLERPDGAALSRFEISLVIRNGLHLYQVTGGKP
ncbi:MAG: DUF2723 domain-containing protein [Anaerolineales bacterium]|nr:DUF2723 domain-containing protein [Anaerolineales bacterium]